MQAKKLLGGAALRRQHGLASYKQMKVLQRFGVEKTNVSRANAGKAMDYLKSVHFRTPNVDAATLTGLVSHQRQPGEEG